MTTAETILGAAIVATQTPIAAYIVFRAIQHVRAVRRPPSAPTRRRGVSIAPSCGLMVIVKGNRGPCVRPQHHDGACRPTRLQPDGFPYQTGGAVPKPARAWPLGERPSHYLPEDFLPSNDPLPPRIRLKLTPKAGPDERNRS